MPPGAPHPAARRDPGHPCDSPTDVLYPLTGGEPLSQHVLDFNHDDYYGHSGSWPDIQDSAVAAPCSTCPRSASTVSFSGAGAVTSDLPGVECTASCTTQWDAGSVVQLEAAAAAADRFVRWTGACNGRAAAR